MDKRYKYRGKIYSDEDLSEETDNYGGDLVDLFYDMEANGDAKTVSRYYSPQTNEVYESPEDFIEWELTAEPEGAET